MTETIAACALLLRCEACRRTFGLVPGLSARGGTPLAGWQLIAETPVGCDACHDWAARVFLGAKDLDVISILRPLARPTRKAGA